MIEAPQTPAKSSAQFVVSLPDDVGTRHNGDGLTCVVFVDDIVSKPDN